MPSAEFTVAARARDQQGAPILAGERVGGTRAVVEERGRQGVERDAEPACERPRVLAVGLATPGGEAREPHVEEGARGPSVRQRARGRGRRSGAALARHEDEGRGAPWADGRSAGRANGGSAGHRRGLRRAGEAVATTTPLCASLPARDAGGLRGRVALLGTVRRVRAVGGARHRRCAGSPRFAEPGAGKRRGGS